MMELIQPIFKWLHIIAGVMWIGLLYFFNFINGHFAATMDGDTKKKVVPELMPRALYWCRWGAAWTWATGLILLLVVYYHGGLTFDESSNFGIDTTNDNISYNVQATLEDPDDNRLTTSYALNFFYLNRNDIVINQQDGVVSMSVSQ